MDDEISDSPPTFSVMYAVVFSDLRAAFKRASERKIHQCSMDLCLIALSVRYGKFTYDSFWIVWIEEGRYHLWVDRTGYLFDAFVPSVSHTTTPAQSFAGVLIKLREVSCSCRHVDMRYRAECATPHASCPPHSQNKPCSCRSPGLDGHHLHLDRTKESPVSKLD